MRLMLFHTLHRTQSPVSASPPLGLLWGHGDGRVSATAELPIERISPAFAIAIHPPFFLLLVGR
jgi:hypothetical protein